ncbi:PREDICTED: protein timeless homolog [Amphimedon queenslandica]|uniref:Timeless N-terminal domain-containing protein n=1 Tax=Amphimedon queenslandica TaxID=400682 RepID=A0A1X7UEC0_AMPQE|nr:PREDICTED: protein timeless homolog [Amphimedon queenslandica]|eukprot:XP_019854658.1 PREDICTED: protein timeless homolog [Amphimedon queenslandica]
MSSELVATYSALGTKDGDQYYKGPECLACVKDLIRALRYDDDLCGVRRHLGKARILQKDLIPLLVHFNDDIPLRNDIIRLLVNFTQPVILSFPESHTHKDSATTKCMIEVSQYLRQYKEEFTVEHVMNVLGSILAELCQKDWEDRDDDDIIIIERILLLLRNVLHVPSDPAEEKRTDDDVNVHDQIIWNLHINGIDELLLFLGSNPNETQWCMHVLEILFLLLREQSPSNLATAGGARSSTERQNDENKIDELMELERVKQKRLQRTFGSRHSKFGGVYIVDNEVTSTGRNRIYHRSLQGFNDYSFDIEKRPRRTPKPKKRLIIDFQSRPSTYSIRVVLQKFSAQVLDYCFNVLMRVVKDTIKRQHSMENDETYYLWAMRFFMEFSRLHNFRVDIVSESLQLPTVHQVLQLIASYYEHMCMNKRERHAAIEWGQRLHYAVSAYKELLLHVQEMIQSKDDTVVQSSKVILSNLLYHPEYRDVFVMLLRNYNEAVVQLSFLQDVIEMTHVYLRLVKLYSKQNGQLVIQKKRKRTAAKKKTNSQQLPTEDQLMEMWESLESEIQHVITNTASASELPCPFDGASDIPIEEQKIEVMKNIHEDLKTQNISEAVLLMKAAREVWPDDVFGSNTVSPSSEISVLREIFFNPLSVTTSHDYEEEEEEEEEAVQENVTSIELEMDLSRFTAAFANNKIVQVYSLALANYKSNTDELNHAVIKMLHTISIKHEMMPMLFQMSLFRIFSDILDEPPLPRYRELQKFSSRVVADFLILSQQNKMMFAELLIWKTSGECYELKEGYGAIQRKKQLKENRNVWTREQEEELSSLYEQFKNETDIVGCILDALPSEQCRTRGIIVSKLVSKGLVSSRKDLHKKTKTNKEPWSEEELFTLKSLWQPSENINASIEQLLCSFPGRGVRDIKKQLQNLGLMQPSSGKRKHQGDEVLSVETEPRETVKKKGKKGNVDKLVQAIHTNGYSNQLAWLSTYINDEAKDRELDSEWEELCVVPVEQSTAEALETEVFHNLMISIGLMPPSEQEMYWRIPSSMSPHNLQTITESLNVPQRDTDSQITSVPEDEETQDIQNMSTNSNAMTNEAVSWSDDEDDNPHLEPANDRDPSLSPSEALELLRKEREAKQPPSKRIRVRTQFDSDDDDGGGGDNEVSSSRSISKERDEPRRLKRNALYDSDDDDD